MTSSGVESGWLVASPILVSCVHIELSTKFQNRLGGELSDVGKGADEELICTAAAYKLGSQ